MAITNADVVQWVEDERSLAELLTVVHAACVSRKSRMDQHVQPLIGTFDDTPIESGRPGVQNVTAYQAGVMNGLLGTLIAALEAAAVNDTLEAFAVRRFEVRTFPGFTA